MSASATVHDQLDHPVVDGDGHWLEPVPVFLDFLRDEAGAGAVDAYRTLIENNQLWYAASPEERLRARMPRPGGWVEPGNTRDRATAMLPGLLHERLPELGIDFALVYPTLGIMLSFLPDDDIRRGALRALNRMTAELFAPWSDRLTPVATIDVTTPSTASEETEFAVTELGFRAIVIMNGVIRPVEADPSRSFVDFLGLDSAYDYDPFWAMCQEMGVAVTDHGSGIRAPDRLSVTNFVHNHLGHFAMTKHASCRGLFMGGVTRRFPSLNFAFLEGGVGWARNLLLDLVGHWEKRNVAAMEANLKPTNVDLGELERLFDTYGSPAMKGRFDEVTANFSCIAPFMDPEGLTNRELDWLDEFGALDVATAEELVDLFERPFYFGCEADDPMTLLAFDDRLGPELKPVFGSDVSHFDVPDMSGVLDEAWELVDHGLIDRDAFRKFTFTNVVQLHGGMNPGFFDGTVVEAAAKQELAEAAKT